MIARLVICFFALQTFFLAAGPIVSERTLGAVGWNVDAATSENCAAQGNDAQPPHGQHDACKRCVFCAAGGRDVSFLIAAIFIGMAASTDDVGASPPPSFSNERDTRPIGWASTWSSRAPPAFS